MVIVLCVSNVGMVIAPCIMSYRNTEAKKAYIKGSTFPAVTAGILGIAAIYYLLCFSNPDWSILRLVGLKSEIKLLCTHKRHPYFGYKYRVFITEEKTATRPVGPSVSPNMARTLGPSSQAPAIEVPEIDSAVLAEVLD